MADDLDDAEFWLPSHFLTEEDILMDLDASTSTPTPTPTPTTFSSTVFNSDLGSPVDTVTETESDEDEFLSGLARQMSLSSLLPDAANSNPKGWAMSGSPQSTLSPVGGSSRGSPTGRVSSLTVPSAGESKKGTGYFDSSRGLLCPPAKHSTPVSISPKNPNIHGVFSPKSQPFQPLWNQEMIKEQRTPPTAWPTVQLPAIRQPNPPPAAQKMRAVFLGSPGSKRESVGTGVFLPRNLNPTEPRKKSNKHTCATVLVPEKVVQALKNINAQSQSHPQPRPDSNRRLQGHNNGVHGGRRSSEKDANFEIRLPSEWTY